MVFGLAILLATGAYASNKSSLHFQEAVQVGGQTVPAGEYQLRWNGSGSSVELSIMKGKQEVAKATARVIELDKPSAYDSTILDHSNGAAAVTEIRFAGKKSALSLGSGEAASMTGSSSK